MLSIYWLLAYMAPKSVVTVQYRIEGGSEVLKTSKCSQAQTDTYRQKKGPQKSPCGSPFHRADITLALPVFERPFFHVKYLSSIVNTFLLSFFKAKNQQRTSLEIRILVKSQFLLLQPLSIPMRCCHKFYSHSFNTFATVL